VKVLHHRTARKKRTVAEEMSDMLDVQVRLRELIDEFDIRLPSSTETTADEDGVNAEVDESTFTGVSFTMFSFRWEHIPKALFPMLAQYQNIFSM
jgi:hypothetical protein